MINRLCIIGVGLIGGSLALALKKNNFCQHIIGCGRNTKNLDRAVALGIIDDYNTDPAKAVKGCDVVLLAVPVGSMRSILEQVRLSLESDTVITDTGSSKALILEAASEVFGVIPANLVPGHPIAGNEKSGVAAAMPDLYQGCRVILTPHRSAHNAAIQRVIKMWQVAGAEVKQMDAGSHDNILAATSHLPHMLAFALIHKLANSPHHEDIFRYGAGGLRDFTRIAESDPVMWRDICLSNKDAILVAIDRYRDELDQLQRNIRSSDARALYKMFTKAHDMRTHFRHLLDACERRSQ